MNSKTITIIGAGLYGCLTAWKLKNKFKNYQINLIDSSDHILSSYDAIKIRGNLYNNGFHGLELPRAEGLYNFFQKTAGIPMIKFINEKKLLIEGNLIDYTFRLKEYPIEIKKFFVKKPNNIIEKMIDGRIRKFLEEIVLFDQVFVIDTSLKISEVIENVAKELGVPIVLTNYARFELGEGSIKKDKKEEPPIY